ncbi:S8 family serine peptidase [Marinigracilibium pacificum]|uniref:S8 family serine peptidase n=1 Tax=Marinigracilibium pacificum TaxID=2729599 RepID=A0A848IX14_9BACT|nr:S8 family serine peptidase [Marinigracilibium pacificum]NMM47708.1 S8 family serine peptidase [Marinigracilibium pacificum]
MNKFLSPCKRAMRANFRGLLFVSLILCMSTSYSQDKITTTPKHNAKTIKFKGHNAIEGVVRIKFKNTEEVQRKLENMMTASENGRFSKGSNAYLSIPDFPEFSAKNNEFGAVNMKRVFRPAGKYEERHKKWGLHLWYEIEYKNDADLNRVLEAYSGIAEIAVAEPRYEMALNTLSGPPNDPQYSTQANHYDLIRALEAWGLETGSSDVIVAIEDQGVDYNHPDLQGHMWINSGETPNNGVDDDNNGYVDDYYGYNFGNDNGNIAIDFHGTHVGGTVSAETNNGVGVAGVAGGSGSDDGVRLMSLSVFGNNAQGGFDEAFIYAADNGAVISQNSWGGGSQSAALENAIDYFIANAGGQGQPLNGGLVVFAAGNSNSQTSGAYPANYAPVIAVASTTYDATKSSFSNYGTWVDIAAPGSNILSTYPVSQGSYNTISGTSMACPHVSGVAALVASKAWREGNPLTAAQLRTQLESTANFDLLYNANSSTYNGRLGSGMLDAYAALGGTGGPPPPPTCEDTEVTLTLTTDRYGSETSWTLTDASGATIDSGSGYGNNQTYTEKFCLVDGVYTFTINDSYGDGICCSYGNGSYAISDGTTTLISGGQFTSTESKDFTIGSGGTTCDTPTGLSSSDVTYNSFTVSWTAVSGADSYDVQVNGSVVADNTTATFVNLTGLSANTIYAVSVRSNCTSGSSSYSPEISITTPSEPGSGCTGEVSSYPYSESFESGLGAWSQGTGDDLNWTRDSGGTPSSGTGPSSGSAGAFYMYVEASSPNYPSKVGYLNSPCFDLSGESSANITFDYHMNGTAMGSLALQASNDNGSSWSNAWSISGSQGNSWKSVSVDLSSYIGGTVQFRFVGTTGSSWSSDIAIDNVSVGSDGGGNSSVTLTLVTDNYGSETSWTLTDDADNVVATGSGYANNQTYTETFNLSGGCYTFTINDSYGDGICCSYGNGSYTLSDANGTIATGGDFGASVTENFCVTSSSGYNLFSENSSTNSQLNEFGIVTYPNPAVSSIKIRLKGASEADYTIVDITGKEMIRGTIKHNEESISIRNLPNGMYIIKASDGKTTVSSKIIKE